MEKQQWQTLVKNAAGGNRQALDALYRLTSNQVYFTCLKLLKDETQAKDAMQDSFLTAMKKLDTLEECEKFQSWINMIAINRCRQFFRSAEELSLDEREEQGEVISDDSFIPEDYVTDSAKRQMIMGMIEIELTDAQRRTVILYYYNELSIAEIAKVMECSEGTVGSRLSAARKKLMEAVLIYEKQNDDRLHAAIPVPILTRILKAEASEQPVPNITIPWENIPAGTPADMLTANISNGGKKVMFATLKGKINSSHNSTCCSGRRHNSSSSY